MELTTAVAHVRKALKGPGGRAAIRAIGAAAGIAGRLGHPALAVVAVVAAEGLSTLAGEQQETEVAS